MVIRSAMRELRNGIQPPLDFSGVRGILTSSDLYPRRYTDSVFRLGSPAPQASSRLQIQLTPSVGSKKQSFQSWLRPRTQVRSIHSVSDPHLARYFPYGSRPPDG